MFNRCAVQSPCHVSSISKEDFTHTKQQLTNQTKEQRKRKQITEQNKNFSRLNYSIYVSLF